MADVLTQIIAIFGLIIAIFVLILRYLAFFKERKIEFMVERYYEPTKKPVDSEWGIRIQHLNKPIEKCSVLYNGELIPWWDKNQPYYERSFVAMGGGVVRVPKAIQDKDAKIKIQNNKKTLRTVKFKDIHTKVN